MPKPLSLTDMLLQRTEGSTQDRAQDAGKSRGAPRVAKPAKPEFIPEQASPSRKAARANESKITEPKTFHERVKESQAKMSRKDHSFFKKPGAKPMDRSAADTKTPAIREPNASQTREAASEARPAKVSGRKEAAKAGGAEAWSPKDSRPMELKAAHSEDAKTIAEVDGWEAVSDTGEEIDYDGLQQGLEELGIEATPDQLRDPAFLAQMLWLIDAVPMTAPLIDQGILVEAEAPAIDAPVGAIPDVAAEAGSEESSSAAVQMASVVPTIGKTETRIETEAVPAPKQSAESVDWSEIAEPEREEIAALIREKLGTLADKPEFRAGPGTAETTLPSAIRMARAGGELPIAAEAPKADIALADPDRLRVLQNAGLTTLEGRAAQVEMGFEDPEAIVEEKTDYETAFAAPSKPTGNGAKEDGQSLPDLMGRHSQAAAENAGPKDAVIQKDASPTHFQSAMDQARGFDAKAETAKAPLLQQPALHEQNVLAQIARKMSALANRGTEEIRIQLEPEHLGRVRIALEMRDGGLTARIGVESESVRQLVDANMSGLRDSLENQGIKIQGMEVSVEQRHESLFNPDGSNARDFFQRRGQDAGVSEREISLDAAAETDTGRRLGYNTMEYIA